MDIYLHVQVRLLCFGASLTEGYTIQENGKFHPYSIKLRRLLEEHIKGASVVVDTAGVSGEVVVPTMTQRLDQFLKESSQPYGWIIILGGTNNLGRGLPAEELLPNLLGLHYRAKQTGCRTLALALPQFRYELSLPKDEMAQYWVDGLHMTPKGYDKMAQIVFDHLKQHM